MSVYHDVISSKEGKVTKRQLVMNTVKALSVSWVLWFHVVQVDIPEEQGNVVVLYEVC